MTLTNRLPRRCAPSQPNKRLAPYALVLLLAAQLPTLAHAATITVTSTAANRGTFTELQCLPPGSDVDAGAGATTVTGGATLAAAQADGAVTLREAICVANNTPEADVIVLTPATYTLSTVDNHWYGPNALPPIADDITIEGNGAVISRSLGAGNFRLFFISRKTLTDGIAIRGGADRAQLVLRDVTLRNGLARGGNAQLGGGGAGMGGAIFNQGSLTLERVTLANNEARGGESGLIGLGFFRFGAGGGIGEDSLSSAGGFGPGLFGGATGGAGLYSADPAIDTFPRYGCGGGAGFGIAPGSDASVGTVNFGQPEKTVLPGDGGGLGRVGGSSVFAGLCSIEDPSVCMGQGQDGGGGGSGGTTDTLVGTGGGGGFGKAGGIASTCGGGGGVGGGGGPVNDLGEGGPGGFGGGGGSANVSSTSEPIRAGGQGGFGGGGGTGGIVEGSLLAGAGGFGGGTGGEPGVSASGGGGAGMGGALFNHGGIVVATNTTWSANRATGGNVSSGSTQAQPGSGLGGALFNLDGDVTLTFSTLSGNVVRPGSGFPGGGIVGAAAGGAVYNRVQDPGAYGFASRFLISQSILTDSLDGEGTPISDCNRSARSGTALSADLFSPEQLVVETSAQINGNENHLQCSLGTSSILADAQLQPVAANGGLTPTMAPAAASPALDIAGTCTAPLTDQRGLDRPQGLACDAGAFEFVCEPGGVRRVDAQAAAGGDGASWATALSDLQDALSDPAACEVWVAAGVYTPTSDSGDRLARFTLRNWLAVYGGFSGTETEREQRDHRTNVTVLSGDIDGNDSSDAQGVVQSAADAVGANSYRVVEASAVNASAVLDGFTITAGMADAASGANRAGAGMRVGVGGTPTLRNLDFVGNRAVFVGGGLFTSGSAELTNVSFRGNAGGDGAGMFNDLANARLTNVEFSGNSGNAGAGLMVFGGSPVLTNVSFSGNAATGSGGAIRNTLSGQPVIRNAVLWNNRDASGTGTRASSISSVSGSLAHIASSLVQGCKPGGTWVAACGTDVGGNLADVDPQFFAMPSPVDAPSASGDLRLRARSPAVDAGNGADNLTALDLAGNARLFGPDIDLGAYENPYLGLSLSVTGSGSGSAALVSPLPGRFDSGEDVTVIATPASDSDFSGWSGDLVASDNPLTFAISGDTALTANFVPKTFEVVATAIGSGSITPSSQTIEYEGTASFVVEPSTGWSLSSVTGAPCTPVNTGGTDWQADSITADCAVEAVFTVNAYRISGTVSGLAGSGLELALNGVVESLAITDNGPFAFSTALDHDTGYTVTVATQPTGPSQTCTVINDSGTITAADVTDIEVSCVTDTYSVTATAIGNGTITPPAQTVEHGSAASFSVTPDANHHLVAVTGDTCAPADQGAGAWSAANITQPCAVSASFARDAADLQIAKDSGVDAALDGQVLVYAITVANAGPAAVSGAQLVDVLPANLIGAEWACLPAESNTACPPAPFDAGSGDLNAEIDLPVDGFLRYDLSARVQADGGTLVSNTATVTMPAEIDELDPSNNSATDATLIVPEGIFASGFEAGPGLLTVPAAAKAQREAAGR